MESYFVNYGMPPVIIDKEGSYKYVLIKIEDSFGKSALVIRSCPKKDGTKCKHPDAFKKAQMELQAKGLKATCLGGGRITRHPSKHLSIKAGYVSIFGYSKTFGKCDTCNRDACVLVKGTYVKTKKKN